jgi:hypothetical protein
MQKSWKRQTRKRRNRVQETSSDRDNESCKVHTHNNGFVIVVTSATSSDSDDADRSKARKQIPGNSTDWPVLITDSDDDDGNLWNATKTSPVPASARESDEESSTTGSSDLHSDINDDNDGNLWNAIPPTTMPNTARETEYGGTTSSGSTGSSDGSLSDDFIDKRETEFTPLQQKTLMRFFPIMMKSMIEGSHDS